MSGSACPVIPDPGEGGSSATASKRTVNGGDGVPARAVFLRAGQIFTSAAPAVVTTILGSCVSVCLWDSVSGAGGVNHYLLPVAGGRRQEDAGRFGEMTIPRLIDELLALGCRKRNLAAKVFGGANVLGAAGAGKNHIGTKNAEVAFAMLSAEGIPVLARDVGGSRGRKVIFHTQGGSVWVRKL